MIKNTLYRVNQRLKLLEGVCGDKKIDEIHKECTHTVCYFGENMYNSVTVIQDVTYTRSSYYNNIPNCNSSVVNTPCVS